MHPICCGLDVHKDMVSACIIITEADGEVSFVVIERDINMISQPSAQQIVGLDHVNETTIPQG